MTNLHERLQETVNERLRIAEAATPGPWAYDGGLGMVVVIHDRDSLSSVASASAADAAFVIANDPARIIRDCQRDLRVLERHAAELGTNPARCAENWRYELDECPEIRDLAEAYQIDAEEPQ